MNSNTDFGDPGPGSAGPFLPGGGWLGDPSLAPVTDPNINVNGSRVIFASLGFDSNFSISKGGSDVLVALSQDGGTTWVNSAHYANLPGCGSGGSNGQCIGTDSTFIMSDPYPPYSTYVAWTATNVGYLNWVRYDASANFTRGPNVIQIPGTVDTGALHPKFTFGRVATCGGPVDEFIFVAWSSGGGGEDCTGTPTTDDITWHWAAFDTITQTWYPSATTSWVLDHDPTWPLCIGAPINTTVGERAQNRPFTSAMARNNNVVFVHDRSTPHGTRIMSQEFSLSCQGGTIVPTAGPSSLTPDPCFNDLCGTGGGDGGVGNGPDGGYVTNDEWGPIATLLLAPPSTQLWLVSWYGTRNDPNNVFTAIYGSSTGSPIGTLFTTIQPIASGSGVPWDHTRNVSHTLLDAWGGDARMGGPSSIWTARITP